MTLISCDFVDFIEFQADICDMMMNESVHIVLEKVIFMEELPTLALYLSYKLQ